MKKNLKKSLSLFLAVLMMLSCWVWVAPEKVEAAYNVSDNYKVEIVVDVSNPCDAGHVTCNGTTVISSLPDSFKKEGTQTLSFETTSFPTTIFLRITTNARSTSKGTIKSIKINGKTVLSGGWGYNTTKVFSAGNDDFTFTPNDSGTGGNLTGTWDWKKPEFAQIRELAVSGDVEISKLPNGAEKTVTVSVKNGYDQYGVKFDGTVPATAANKITYELKRDETTSLTSTYGTIKSDSDKGTTATVTLNDDIQTLFPNASNGKIYAYATHTYDNHTKTVSIPINLTFPTYDITFNANGGKIGSSDSDAQDSITVTGIKYQGAIGKSPAYRAKAGFDFEGFYSVQNSDATGLTPSFSGTLYKDGETTVDAAGDYTWYAAWQAKPITATFMTADNQLIGKVEGRYNNYLTATNMYNGLKALNAKVKEAYSGTNIQFDSSNAPIYKDGDTTYTFAGWKIIEAYEEGVMDGDEDTVLKGDVTFQAVYTKADAKKYTVSFEDGAGNVTASKSGYNYRDAVTGIPSSASKGEDDKYSYEFIGWAKKLANVNYFAVDANDCDEDGVKLSYTSKDAAEFTVKGDATYVPVFRTTAREYSVTFSYKIDGGTDETLTVDGYHWGDTITVPESIKDNYTADGSRYTIESWSGSTVVNDADVTLTAVYDAGIPAIYTINFYDKDGKLINEVNSYTHNSDVEAPTVGDGEGFDIPYTIDTDTALYTFAGWSPAVNTTATADADYHAQYTEKKYANVSFYNYDGSLIYSLNGKENGLFVGEAIPEYSNIDEETGKNVFPTKEEDAVGTYTFTGWADGNGNEVVPGTDTFSGHISLYAQFETNYKNYTVKFLNDDGSVISEKTYHYATEIEIPADPEKDADDEFEYSFRAWSPDVSKVCYGDATYTATYRRSYKYYTVTWLNDAKAVISSSNYKYNAKIQQATIKDPVNYNDPETGFKWVFSHWVQCNEIGNDIIDKDGNQIIFQRGMKMPAEALYFYPVFVQEENVLKVTFCDENGTPIEGAVKEFKYGADFDGSAFESKVYKKHNETKHFAITGWVNVDTGAEVKTVVDNISVKPVYTAEDHTMDIESIISYPTCTEVGYANMKCTNEACEYREEKVAIDIIEDIAAPTGKIYVGSASWNNGDAIDYSEITYVGPETKLIVNGNDLGSRSKQNPEAELSRGVGKIAYYVSEGVITDTATILDSDWTTVYDYEAVANDVLNDVLLSKGYSMNDYINMNTPGNATKLEIENEVKAILATYKANATGVVSNLGLEDGNDYIIYIKISDREVSGLSNSCVFSSGTIRYGTKAAEITVTGEGSGTKFCSEASVRISDDADGLQIYLDGKEVEAFTNPGTTSANGTFVASFKATEKGLHTVTVIDKNGNKSIKTFEIKGNHSYKTYLIAPTCLNGGSSYSMCTLCGDKINVVEFAAKGHMFGANENYWTDKAATCTEDGSRTYICENNCGEKLVLTPTSIAEDLAKANITADDIKHLKATGVHTYAKALDKDGKETTEDAWVIDKAATCIEVGEKHKDCTVCGKNGRVTEVIAEDTVNGHKFYRAAITTAPTCTTKGEKTKTCRYCGEVVFVEFVDALGHKAGEYEEIKAATCEEAGSKILKCSVCNIEIGEPIKDADGNITGFDGKAVEIAKLGHAWKLDGEIYQDAEDGKWYQNYKCSRCGKIEAREVSAPPAEVTIMFDFNGGYYTVPSVGNPNEFGYVPEMIKGTQTITKHVGESISAEEVGDAFMLENATKTYTFSHWVDAEGKEVKFPIEVKGDATYSAVFTSKYKNYTLTYWTEGGAAVYKKTGYLHYGDDVTLVDGPAKAQDVEFKYDFAGWAVYVDVVDEETGETVKKLQLVDDEITIEGNISLYATYTKTTRKYAVTYAISSSEILETFLVDAKTTARACPITPTKKYDSKYHYTFKEWNRAKQLLSVESNIYTTPNFDSVAHSYTVTIKQERTCTSNALLLYTCECGHSYEAEGTGEEHKALGHAWGDAVFNKETGKFEKTCSLCNATDSENVEFKISYYKEDSNSPYTFSYNVVWNTLLSTLLPADPVKAPDSMYTYTFKGWAYKGESEVIADTSAVKVQSDLELVAIFTPTIRTYKVTFAYDAYNVIKVYKDVQAGSSVTYSGTTPTKKHDDSYHYAFSGWSGSTSNILGDVYVTAQFSKEAHTTTSTITSATCEKGEGTVYTCTKCAYKSDVVATSQPLGHNYVELIETKVLPTEDKDGSVTMECTRCKKTYVKVLPYEGGSSTEKPDMVTIKITVKDQNGNGVSGATVALYQDSKWVAQDITNSSGVVAFVVAPGKYTVVITGVKYAGDQQTEITVNDDGSISGSIPRLNISNCGCACHRDNLWGKIFRFFHTIIKKLTGEFKCCKDPSNLY